jgi:hypothetical protein
MLGVVLLVLYFVAKAFKSRYPMPSMSANKSWGKLGDWDTGSKVFDEGELFEWPYYRNDGWSWWFHKHDRSKARSSLVSNTILDYDGSVNVGQVEQDKSVRAASFPDENLFFEDSEFTKAPPVAWIEKKE